MLVKVWAQWKNKQYGNSIEFCVPAHFVLRMLLAFSQPVNCIFWRIETLNWLVATSKLHKHRKTCFTAEWPYCAFAILWVGQKQKHRL